MHTERGIDYGSFADKWHHDETILTITGTKPWPRAVCADGYGVDAP
jgi:transposase-like protein